MLRRTRYYYPIRQMNPGDSFFVPCLDTERVLQEANLLAKFCFKQIGYRYEIKDGLYGVRIWLLSHDPLLAEAARKQRQLAAEAPDQSSESAPASAPE